MTRMTKFLLGIVIFGLFTVVFSIQNPTYAYHTGPTGFTSGPVITSITNTTCTSITLTWNHAQPQSDIVEYSIAWRYNDGTTNWQNIVVLPPTATSYTATTHSMVPPVDLTMHTGEQYFFQLGARNKSLTGGYQDNGYDWTAVSGKVAACPVATPTPTPTPTATPTPTSTPPAGNWGLAVSTYCNGGTSTIRSDYSIPSGSNGAIIVTRVATSTQIDSKTNQTVSGNLITTSGVVGGQSYRVDLLNTFASFAVVATQTVTASNCLPELTTQIISLFPANPVVNQAAVATVRVTNSTSVGTGFVRVRFWSHQPSQPNFSTAQETGISDFTVQLGGNSSIDLPFTFIKNAAANYTAYALVDNGDPGAVDEINDTVANNISARNYIAVNLPNFVINSITLNPSSPAAGNLVTATVNVRNNGLTGSGPARLRFWSHLGAAPIYTTAAESGIADQSVGLAAGASQNFTFTFTKVSTGNYVAYALVDNGDPGAVDETDDSIADNSRSLAYTVGTGKDYTLSWINPGDQGVNQGGAANFSFRIDPDCSPSWAGTLTVNVSYSLSPNDGNISGLPAGSSYDISCSPFANRDIAFTLNASSSAPKGQVYSVVVRTSAAGLADKTLNGSLTINQGNWLKTEKGDVYSAAPFNLSTPPATGQFSSDYLAMTSGVSSPNLTSAQNWKVASYGPLGTSTSYAELKQLAGGNQIAPLTESPCNFTTATKPTLEGVRVCNNSVTISMKQSPIMQALHFIQSLWPGRSHSIVPAVGAVSSDLKETIIFVEGDLTIGSNLDYSGNQVALFVVKGQIKIANNVNQINAYLFAENGITTSYDTQALTSQLVITGGVAVGKSAPAGAINFNRQVANAATTAAERIIYDPRVLIAFADVEQNRLGAPGLTFTESQP